MPDHAVKKRRRRAAQAIKHPAPERGRGGATRFFLTSPDSALHILACGLLLAAAFALYGGALNHPLIFDDLQLTETFLRGYGRSLPALDLRWLPYASFGWTYHVFGLDPYWLRAGNVLLHGAVGVAMYALLVRILNDIAARRADRCPPRLAALLCALVFVAHPVAVYATAYLMQRATLMATLFGLVALIAWHRGLSEVDTRQSRRWMLAAVGAYFVAVFCKEHAVALPFVAAAMAVLPRPGVNKPLRSFAVPAMLAGLTAVMVVLRARGVLGAPYEPFAQGAIARLAESSLSGAGSLPVQGSVYMASVVNQASLFFKYVLLWAVPWPGWMSIDLRPAFPAQWMAVPQVVGLAAWLAWGAVAAGLAWRARARAPAWAALGWAMLCPWMLALTEFAAVRIQEPFVLYRSYLWMAGAMLAPGILLCHLSTRVALGAALVAAGLCVAGSLERIGSLSSELRVWDDAVRKISVMEAPLADRPWRNRGVAHYHLGQYEAAMSDFAQALRLAPKEPANWLARGTLHMRAARSEDALADFNQALALDGNDAEALGRRCIVHLRLRQLDAARMDCLRALELDSADASAYVSLGMVYAMGNNAIEARRAYETALKMAPSLPEAHYQLGVLLAGTGRLEEARPHWRRACAAQLEVACQRLRN